MSSSASGSHASRNGADHYRVGMDAFNGGQLSDALAAFDKAISLGDRSFKVLDAKAAVLTRIGERHKAFDIASSLCKRYGDKSPKPWYRVATILCGMGMYDAAERSITKGLHLPCDTNVTKALTDLRNKNRSLRTKSGQSATAEHTSSAKAKAKMSFSHLLSFDVLVLVAQAGLATDPNFPIRMAGVCRDWRSAMLGYGPLWGHLRLSKRRPVQKVAIWMSRNKGRLRELTITDHVPRQNVSEAAIVLAPHLEHVQNIVLDCEQPARYTSNWENRCPRLRSLIILDQTSIPPREHLPKTLEAYCRILPPDASQLETLDLSKVDGLLGDYNLNLRALRKLRLPDGTANDISLPQLLATTEHLSELSLGLKLGKSSKRDPTVLPKLTKLELIGTESERYVNDIECPSVQQLHCTYWHRTSALGILESWNVSLSNLVVLEMSWTNVQDRLLAALPHLTALQFLCVPYCFDQTNALIEALVVEEGKPVMLPNLTALSVAGITELTAGPIRRLVLSRNAPEKLVRAVQPAAPRKRSAFAPTRPTSQSSVLQTVSSASNATLMLSPPPHVAKLTWLCVDECVGLYADEKVIKALRPYVGFISFGNVLTPSDNERVRGQGAYRWDSPQLQELARASQSQNSTKRKEELERNQERWIPTFPA